MVLGALAKLQLFCKLGSVHWLCAACKCAAMCDGLLSFCPSVDSFTVARWGLQITKGRLEKVKKALVLSEFGLFFFLQTTSYA